MIVISLIILAILFFTFIVSYRSNRIYAFSAIPLAVLPALNILAFLITKPLSFVLPFSPSSIFIAINILAAIITSVSSVIFSKAFKTKMARIYYLAMSILYTIVLAWIYILIRL